MRISRWKNKLKRFGALSAADQWLLVRAVGWLAVARIMLLAMSFRRLAASLSGGRDLASTAADPAVLSSIGWAVAAAANNVPWRSDCFPQTIAARKLLKKYGYQTTIHIGVERAGNSGLAGHAWLTCGEELLTGRGVDLSRYTELHSFTAL